MRKGLVHIYTGDGKGKTTAAVGMSLRAKGRGLNVLFTQFFKEKSALGEIPLLQQAGIDVIIFDTVKSPFFNPGIDRDRLSVEARLALSAISECTVHRHYDLVILDEFICLIGERVISEPEAISFLQKRPADQEVVLTGNGATEGMISHADYVTNMQKVKHPYALNTAAREGIEY
ncbi:MAG: cob(I)yrinic acid a,c-diamide adenosyltransferase [Nitrospiraceae bacterium]|nr:cob(I)yrinic acid a,c-diamide adenosyltransferase [Nitrospiraceae bacterium]